MHSRKPSNPEARVYQSLFTPPTYIPYQPMPLRLTLPFEPVYHAKRTR